MNFLTVLPCGQKVAQVVCLFLLCWRFCGGEVFDEALLFCCMRHAIEARTRTLLQISALWFQHSCATDLLGLAFGTLAILFAGLISFLFDLVHFCGLAAHA